ncbi:hypothetical protein [Demequina oxidasica]|uniref:hypothetical protein n=1 Tax=Demequina oxidasica TaxID=676199 RepID=UPI0007804BE7|nr:hypothetical protein [Demequina oxidasica]
MDPILFWFEERYGDNAAYEVKTYRLNIRQREVEVEVRNYGASALNGQYVAYARLATIPEGKELLMNTYGESLGNGDYTPEGALFNIHWEIFDQD